ncbi:sulfite exporter TauE/SafE family protein [Roseinatronobacter sp.]|uniref:sulfite exporter TauE/SafE family protein n=1 Tax=Roseinatronobacter sp. TaxID=1945755 RepID=UPI0025FBED3B|nr:sulfite exporter TauE/SafE family protein [Roseibaca sp.]
MQALAELTLFGDVPSLTAALVAVFLVGLSKGGLGGAFALMGVPILSLVMSPVQAAALLLPVLLMMDAVSLWAWRGWFDRATLWHTLPGAAFGIALGGLTAAYTPEAMVRLLVGVVALGFVARMALARRGGPVQPRGQSRTRGSFWGGIAGFTSFVAHAGGPPFQVYALPLGFDPRIYTGTTVIFFSVVNVVKLVPYAALGQFNTATLTSALVLLPLAVGSTLLGAKVVKHLRAELFYPLMYGMIALVGVKLVWDGLAALLG